MNKLTEGRKEEYRAFFVGKLKKYKVKSVKELSDTDKQKFYDEIEKEWTAVDEEVSAKQFTKQFAENIVLTFSEFASL
jgi:hypothetical protein